MLKYCRLLNENMYTHLFTILLPAALGELMPDVRFDEKNDRFDLTPLVQQGAYDQWADFVDGMRRSHRYFREIEDLSSVNSYERDADQYDQFIPRDGRKDLVNYLHGDQPRETKSSPRETRRSGAQVDKEVLMHHAVPLVMKLEGILRPLDEE